MQNNILIYNKNKQITMDEEYLKLFGNKPQQSENLNETKQTWENLNKPQQNQWQNLNETPNTQQYNINENVNDGWGTMDFVIEKRVNGVPEQQQNNHPYHSNPRRRNHGGGLNGLDMYADEDLREVVRQPQIQQIEKGPVEMMAPPVVENIKDVEIVSVDLFENMNSNALLTLANGKLARIDVSKVTNNASDTKVTFLNS